MIEKISFTDYFQIALNEIVLNHQQALISDLLKPCIKIKISKSAQMPKIGTSKIGGIPDLPEGLEWPKIKNVPFRFLMQISMEELPEDPRILLGFPEKGHLYFFLGDDEPCYQIPNLVIYSALAPFETKNIDTSKYYDQWDFHACDVSFFQWMSLPNYESIPGNKDIAEMNEDLYSELNNRLEHDWQFSSQLGGYPDVLKPIDEIRHEALLNYYDKNISFLDFLTPPDYPDDDIKTAERMNLLLLAEDYKKQYEDKLLEHKNIKRWLDSVANYLPKFNVLLSLASHEEANMCWWDAAAVNFFVLDSEIKSSTFKKTYAFLESS